MPISTAEFSKRAVIFIALALTPILSALVSWLPAIWAAQLDLIEAIPLG